MKIYYIPLLLLFVFFSSKAQINVGMVEKGEIFKTEKHNALLATQGDGEGGFVTVSVYFSEDGESPQGYTLRHFDKNLNLRSEKKFKIDNNRFRGLLVKDGKVFIFNFRYNEKSEKYVFEVLKSSLDTFKFKKQTLLTFENETQITGYYSKDPYYPNAVLGLENADWRYFRNVVFSNNNNYFGLVFNGDSGKGNYRAVVYNTDLEKVFDLQTKLSNGGQRFIQVYIRVGNDGSLYILGKIAEIKDRKREDQHYCLVKISGKGLKKVEFKNPTYHISSLYLIKAKNKLVCAGFYSALEKKQIMGMVRLDMNPKTLKITHKAFVPFKNEFWLKNKNRNFSLPPKNNQLFDNGNIVINMEDHSVKTGHRDDGTIKKIIYYYRNIGTFKISPQGEILSANFVNKYQVFQYDPTANFHSFCSATKNGKTYFFLNAKKKHIQLDNGKWQTFFESKKGKKTDLFAISVDENGNISDKNILPHEKSDFVFNVEYGETIAEGELILVGKKEGQKRLIKISY